MADELWERLLQGEPMRNRRIIELRRAGHTHKEIARELGLNEKTVRRTIRRILDEQIP